MQKKRSKQRAEYLQSNTRTKLKPERSTRPIPKKRRPLYATATRPILNLSDLLKGGDTKGTPRRTVLLKSGDMKNLEEKRAAKTKGGDMKRTSREIALLIGRNISYH